MLGRHTGTLYIGVTSNIYLRVLQHKESTLEGFTAAYGCRFKDRAQTWGWKMITVHEKMYP
ncbi:MAG TPA: hypothetical protein VFE27_00970 [Acidobacteriaceae bacterium]|nr:hypothetical protein [Acidobacteriaceae bacterium]